ncbi:hypothetical protein BGY98DRAFT_1100900 [Russula aff. rugulosa BPL654]|nr:hypothetical protein BGY98DRAFT_1100900 [Russula aff. rugulosa BPL654]
MSGATKNAKVVAIALGSLQRLTALRAVSLSAIPAIIQTINDCMSRGVDIQLRFSSPHHHHSRQTTSIKLIGGIDARDFVAMSSSWTVSGSVTARCRPTVTPAAPGAPIFTLLISALKRLAIPRPTQLGVSAQTHEVGVTASDSQSHLQTHRSLDNIAEMVVTAVVSNVVRMIGTQAGLSVQTAATKVPCIDQLDKTDAPLIPEAYIHLLGMQHPILILQRPHGAALPPRVVAVLNEPQQASSICTPPSHLRTQDGKAFQDAEYVLTTRGAATPGRVPDYLITQLAKILLLDHESSWRRITVLSLSLLLGRCRSTLVSYVAIEKIRGTSHSQGKRSYYMYCINYGSFDYGQGSSGGSFRNSVQVRKGQPVVDTSLPPADLIAGSGKRSSRAQVLHFYSLLCEIASVSRKMPTAWIADRLAVLSGVPAEKEKKEMDTEVTSRIHDPSSSRRGAGHPVLFDVRELARSDVGRESKFGVSRLS